MYCNCNCCTDKKWINIDLVVKNGIIGLNVDGLLVQGTTVRMLCPKWQNSWWEHLLETTSRWRSHFVQKGADLGGFWVSGRGWGQGGSTHPFYFLVLVNLSLPPTPGTSSAAQDSAPTSQDPALDLMILEWALIDLCFASLYFSIYSWGQSLCFILWVSNGTFWGIETVHRIGPKLSWEGSKLDWRESSRSSTREPLGEPLLLKSLTSGSRQRPVPQLSLRGPNIYTWAACLVPILISQQNTRQ